MIFQKKINLLIIIFLVAVCSVHSQDLYQKKYPVEELREDFEILQKALQEGHPNLYRYTPKTELDIAFREQFYQINEEQSELEFYNFIKPLIAKIQDGNTTLMLSDYSDNFLKDRARFFPFDVKFIDKKTYVRFNYTDNKQIKIGAEILSINGIPTEEILEEMIKRNSSDAGIENAVFWRLEQGTYSFELLAIYEDAREYDITFRNIGDSDIQVATVMAASYRKKITDFIEAGIKPIMDTENPFKVHFLKDKKTAILDIDILGDFFKGNQNFYRFLKQTFKDIQKEKIEHLILDLRNNTGGEDLYGAYLCSFLIDNAFQLFSHQLITQKKYNFVGDTDSGLSLNREFSALKTTETDSGTYIISLDGLEEEQFPARENFKGDLYILTNGGTFGIASYVAGLLKFYRKAPTLLIGEETGGALGGGTGVRLPYLTLPNTNLVLTLPLVSCVTQIPENQAINRGVMPDYKIKDTPRDLLENRDAVLEFTQKRIIDTLVHQLKTE